MNLKDISEKIQVFFGKFPYFLCTGMTPNQYFCCRELTHFLGGVIIGLVPALTGSILFSVIAGLLMFGIIVWKEIDEDNRSQGRFKTIVDVLAWTIGFMVPTFVKYLI